MKTKFLGLMLAGLLVIGGSAQAAVLSLNLAGATTGQTIPSNFNPTGWPGPLVGPLVTQGVTPITIYGPGSTGGLQLDTAANLTFQYLGKEASYTNVFHYAADLFNTDSSSPGASAQLAAGAGIIPFLFQTLQTGLSAENGGPIAGGPAPLSIAFADLGDGSFLALFNDGGGQDTDYDDMVVRISVSAVPLPAAAWLLISAVLGLVSFSRIRRTGTQSA